MINSWTLSILRILFVSIFTPIIIIGIYNKDSSWIYCLIICFVFILIDFFLNQKIIFKDKYLVIFSFYRVKKIKYSKIRQIYLKATNRGKFIGMCYDIDIILKDNNSIKMIMGPLILFNKAESKIHKICNKNGIKYSCDYIK